MAPVSSRDPDFPGAGGGSRRLKRRCGSSIRGRKLVPGGGSVEQTTDPDAPAQGQADVLLHALPEFLDPQDVLPGRDVQQEQHSPARQVVLKLQMRGEEKGKESIVVLESQKAEGYQPHKPTSVGVSSEQIVVTRDRILNNPVSSPSLGLFALAPLAK
ncbi:hypothetical protein ElyMa_003850600 [Elysia marginata]|uniref:Uncharacterized protein n=1 Tax=Elysia marginata TaxID=1093978 RepID=A0AAV4FHN4_9GAST|nr:hypothetical protein ElyMa_003850600 [Elysia marginata]